MAKAEYNDNLDLPDHVRYQLSTPEQDVYRIAYNNACAAGATHSKAHEAGWRAVEMYKGHEVEDATFMRPRE
jgi:cation transport regulator ChaB